MATPLPAGANDMLIFRVAGDIFALPSAEITAITRPPAITRVPGAPANLLGVANMRGVVAPIVSLAGMLGRPQSAASGSMKVLMVDRATPVGLVVDEVCAFGAAPDAERIDLEFLLSRDFGPSGARSGRKADIGQAAAPGKSRGNTPASDAFAVIGFMLNGQEYALPLEKITEVLAFPRVVTATPLADAAMMGMVAHRGGLLPLVSARRLLGLPSDGFDRAAARIVVMRYGSSSLGLVVDAMSAISRIALDALDAPPPILTRGRGEARIEAIARLDAGHRLVAILSPAALFDSETAARVLTEDKRVEMAEAGPGAGTFARFVVFQLGGESYGLPIDAVEAVIRTPASIAALPRAPRFVSGIVNFRGGSLPLVDQRRRFAPQTTVSSVAAPDEIRPEDGSADASRTDGSRIVVVSREGFRAGLVVDGVADLLTVSAADLAPAPDLTPDVNAIFDRVAMVDRKGSLILIVDPRGLLDQTRRDIMAVSGERPGKVGRS